MISKERERKARSLKGHFNGAELTAVFYFFEPAGIAAVKLLRVLHWQVNIYQSARRQTEGLVSVLFDMLPCKLEINYVSIPENSVLEL